MMIRWARRRAIDGVEEASDGDTHKCDPVGTSLRVGWMLRRVANLLAAALIAGAAFAAPVAAQGSGEPAAISPYTFTSKRIVASSAALVGLVAAVVGGLALARSAGRIGNGTGRRGAIVALVLGPLGFVIGGLVVATADGGLGTGNGLAGGVVAMIVGLIGMSLGGIALARSRRPV
jgi:hypothetical protein